VGVNPTTLYAKYYHLKPLDLLISYCFQIYCDITSTKNGHTLFHEISEPFLTGIIVDSDDVISLSKNGEVYSLVLKQTIPLSCSNDAKKEECKLIVEIKDVPTSKIILVGFNTGVSKVEYT